MSAICIVDTSIFLEILNVPTKAGRHSKIRGQLRAKIEEGEKLFLPMATIFETGNHIAQCGDGNQRRECAQRYVAQVKSALSGHSPFQPIHFLQSEHILQWLDDFPDSAMRGSGLGDLSIIHDFRRVCEQNQGWKVYIWSLDEHLSGYARKPDI